MKSMTGFGRGEFSSDSLKFTVEMKSVNHRYLDANIRIPKEYAYLDAYARMAERFHLTNDLTAARLGAQPEIFRLRQDSMDEDEVWNVLKQAVDQALEMLLEARTREGENLKSDLVEKLSQMNTLVDAIADRYPAIISAYELRLKEKIATLLEDNQIDESRLAAEVVLFADKLATDEETVRLRSHIDTMKKELEKGNDIGRKLDFIAQEMNREANTILSKANDLDTSNFAIDLKTLIEKIREQVQNIE